jgi:superfamily I DNA/RNA helicase
MSWDDGITGPHRDIAASDVPRIAVLAGPGTGKTQFGLMRRVVRLLEQGVPGHRILLLSFTRVAAADLRDKVAQLEVDGILTSGRRRCMATASVCSSGTPSWPSLAARLASC